MLSTSVQTYYDWKDSGLSQRQFAKASGMIFNTVHSRITYAYRKIHHMESTMTDTAQVTPQTTRVSYPEKVYTGESSPIELSVYTGAETIEGDCIVTGDFQLPTTNWKMAEWVYQVGVSTGIKKLLIVGDWINCDAFSYYPPIVPEISFFTECQGSRDLIARYNEHFDLILLTLGNHEKRYLKSKRGMLSVNELMGNISHYEKTFKISPYPYVNIVSGGVKWRATHPRDYSRITGKLGDELAQKHQSNMVLLHQHHVGKVMDSWGRYVIIDGGGIFDVQKMAYVALADSRMPAMVNGFTVIQDGVGELVTPYPAFTDLRRWGLEPA